jgi:hypothetical protein
MVGKGLRFLVLTALAVHVAKQWPDVVRYLKVTQLSVGRGHPEDVPVRGRAPYPLNAQAAAGRRPRRLRLAPPGRPTQHAMTPQPWKRGNLA